MGDTPEIDDLVVKGYQHVVRSGRWDERWLSQHVGAPLEKITEVRRILANLHVIERDAGTSGGWTAVSPRVAMARLVLPIEMEVQRRITRAENLRKQLEALLPVHEAKRELDFLHMIEVVRDACELAHLINEETAGCTSELMVMRAGSGESTSTGSWPVNARDEVKIRTICPHGARPSLPGDGLTEAFPFAGGGEIRTTDEVPVQMLIFDRTRCILMPINIGDDGIEDQATIADDGIAVVARHPAIVSMMAGVFEDVWARSEPYVHSDPQPASIGDELRMSVLRLLATGAKDEAVARRLNISIRTCRRYIAELMRELGATSRFHAGVVAQRRNLL